MDLKKLVTEQINLTHDASSLMSNLAFKTATEDLALRYFDEFRNADVGNTNQIEKAHMKLKILECVVNDLQKLVDIGRINIERKSKTV